MHLEGPWLNTTGKRKGKQKYASAEAKRQAEKLREDWQLLKQRNGIAETKKITAKQITGNLADTYQLRVPPGREMPKIASLDTGWVACTKSQDQAYTGNKVKGIGTMHKSNAVPIFSDQEAVEISTMRR